MKLKTTYYLLIVIVLLLAALTVTTIVVSANSWRSSSIPLLTPPLPPTPGPVPTSVPSTRERTPIRNADEAIERALVLDSRNVRGQPLTKDVLAANPDMIIVEQYATRQEASNVYWGDVFAPEIGAVPVWVVIIKGKVSVWVLGYGGGGLVETDGVTYVISQNSGRLLGIVAGIPQKRSEGLSRDTTPP